MRHVAQNQKLLHATQVADARPRSNVSGIHQARRTRQTRTTTTARTDAPPAETPLHKAIKKFPGNSASIEKMTLKIRQELDLENVVQASRVVQKICERLESKTSFESPILEKLANGKTLSAGTSSAVLGEDEFVIYLSPYSRLVQNNFDTAHELGHLVLHYLWEKVPHAIFPVEFPAKCPTDLESQANQFALSLLLPPKLFAKLSTFYKHNSTLLAVAFEVPEHVIRFRMNQSPQDKVPA